MKKIAIIPAYNEEKNIGKVILDVKKYVDDIVVIDDGSKDSTYEIAKKSGVKVCRHLVNRGLGGALSTGMRAARFLGADAVITLDADGQHDPEEIIKMFEPIIKREADFVIGSRFINFQKMPIFRKYGNYFFNFMTFFLFGLWTSDSQSGMRAFNKKAIEKIDIFTNGMEISSEIIKEAKENSLIIKEVPIKAIYTPYSLSKGQGLIVGLKTLFKLFFLKLTR